MDPILEEFERAISGLTYTSPTIDYVSDLTGQPVSSGIDAAYWARHLRNPVRFTDATATLHEKGISTFIEIGPDGVLSGLIRETLDREQDLVAVPMLRRDRPEPHTAVTAAAHAHTHGTPVTWTTLHGQATTIDLPTYAF
ncbi:hypothetical protein B1L11_44950, partial [Microbispora sp. GKU 823]